MNKKKHWETVYNTKTPQEVSWTQKYPKTSIEFIKSLNYNVRGLYFVPIKTSYSKILYLFKDKDLEITKIKKDTLKDLFKKKGKLLLFALFFLSTLFILKMYYF
jgi:hypothetical protein